MSKLASLLKAIMAFLGKKCSSSDMQTVGDKKLDEQRELSPEKVFICVLPLPKMGIMHKDDLSTLRKIMGESRFVLKVKLELLRGAILPSGARLKAMFSFRCSCSEAEHKVYDRPPDVWTIYAAQIVADYVRNNFEEFLAYGTLKELEFREGSSSCTFTFIYNG